MNKCQVYLCVILFIIKNNSALEYNRQRINTNTDFLLHESGVQTNVPKRDYTNPGLSGQVLNNNQNGGKRDFVQVTPKSTSTTALSSSGPQQKAHSSNEKRDFVAPQFPTLKPIQNNQPPTPKVATSKDSSGKRDFVAPQFPTLKPLQPTRNQQPHQSNLASGSKVQDLVNLYDSKNHNQGTPSYSSILQGSTNKNNPVSSTRVTQLTPTVAPFQPTKPMSFSSVVSLGPKKGSTSGTQIFTTAKPTHKSSTAGSRPSTPVLPSSIVNNNRATTTNNLNTVTDAELQTLSEELLRKDTNNAARYISINYQEKTSSQSQDDKAPLPLLTVSPEAWNIPTVQKLIPLLDNYEKDSLINEHVTPQERIEENNFMDALMSTTVMRHLMIFLKNKGLVSLDPKQQRDFVKQLWFSLYSRGKGKLGSSGFEHTFLSEIKNDGVQGLHNWIYFSKEEAANRVNYLGYKKYVTLNDKGVVLKFHFNYQGLDKPVNAMFIGTSPELEIALYTLCFLTRVDNDCNLKLANNDVNIITYNYRYRSKNLIGTAYPQI